MKHCPNNSLIENAERTNCIGYEKFKALHDRVTTRGNVVNEKVENQILLQTFLDFYPH